MVLNGELASQGWLGGNFPLSERRKMGENVHLAESGARRSGRLRWADKQAVVGQQQDSVLLLCHVMVPHPPLHISLGSLSALSKLSWNESIWGARFRTQAPCNENWQMGFVKKEK